MVAARSEHFVYIVVHGEYASVICQGCGDEGGPLAQQLPHVQRQRGPYPIDEACAKVKAHKAGEPLDGSNDSPAGRHHVAARLEEVRDRLLDGDE